jgi:hypothetical protein
MKPFRFLCLVALLLALGAATAAAGPANTGALGVPANRIAGLWSTEGLVRLCGTELPFSPVRNTLLFHAGGTVVENPRTPPGGVQNAFGVPGTNQRGQALGTWEYHPATNRYWIHLRFDWFVDGVYHGYMTVDREIQLSTDGLQGSGPVSSTRYTADGTVIAQVCGEAVSSRL